MNWFLNTATRTKLGLGFGIMMLMLVAVISIGVAGIRALQETHREFVDQQVLAGLEALAIESDALAIEAGLNLERAMLLELMLTQDAVQRSRIEQRLNDRAKELDAAIEKLRETFRDDPAVMAALSELETLRQSYRLARDEQIRLIDKGQIDKARELGVTARDDRYERMRALSARLTREADRRAREPLERAREEAREAEREGRATMRNLLVAGGLAIVVVLLLVGYLNHIIAEPLHGIAAVARKVSAGDLTPEISTPERADEVGAVATAFRQMIASVREANREVLESVNVVASSAAQIFAAVSEISSSASQTAAAVNQTGSTVAEVKQTTQVAREKARHVANISQEAADSAHAGRRAVEDSIEGMNHIRQQMEALAGGIVRLSEQSQAIGEIISTVNDLAEQSNLLAINAAIEAAKAGEHGKGFAVVAQEVRNLANQSKEATGQVRRILGDIQKATSSAVMATEQGAKAVEAGVRQSTQAGEAIRQLAESIGNAAQAAMQITASSEQQFIGMDQVVLAMENIKHAAAQNVEATRQTETATRNLHELGQKLRDALGRFKM